MNRPPMDGYEPPRAFRRNPRPTPPKDDGKPKCNFCGKPIIWAFPTIPAGTRKRPKYADKPKPFDAEPDKSGKFSLYDAPAPEGGTRKHFTELTALQRKGFQEAGNLTYMPHFGNCPRKDEWGQRGQTYSSRAVTR